MTPHPRAHNQLIIHIAQKQLAKPKNVMHLKKEKKKKESALYESQGDETVLMENSEEMKERQFQQSNCWSYSNLAVAASKLGD